jgi:hypothetical protein
MPELNEEILKFLQEVGPKRFTDLKNQFVPKVCSNQTLCNHLDSLLQEDPPRLIVDRVGKRGTSYRISHEGNRKTNNLLEATEFRYLLDDLENLFNANFKLFERTKEANLRETIDAEYYPNLPKIQFKFYSDKNLQESRYFGINPNAIANDMMNNVKQTFNELIKNKPPTMNRTNLEKLNSYETSISFINDLSQKHNFSFLMYTWFDGRKYSKSLTASSDKLFKLKNGREKEILFLDELSKKCDYSWETYYTEIPAYHELFEAVLTQASLDKIGEIGYVGRFFGWGNPFGRERIDYSLLSVEANLVSETIHRKYPDIPIEENLGKIVESGEMPITLIKRENFIKMKYDALNVDEKWLFIKEGLDITKNELCNDDTYHNVLKGWIIGDNFESALDYIDDVKKNVESYYEEFNAKKHNFIDDVKNVFSFKYRVKNELLDLSDQPNVSLFTSFLYDENEKKWIQDCLKTGIPLWKPLHFEQMGFSFESLV